jgi:hypothetical protein
MLFALGCNAQEKQGRDLPSIYKAYKKDNSVKNKRDFFYAFPTSFVGLQQLYGYDDIKGTAAKYYNVAPEHISLFFKSAENIDNKVFTKKVLDISKNGKWEADAVNYFQDGLRKYFFNHSNTFLELLSKRDKNEISGFWYFFSDGPHFNKEVSNRVLKLLKSNPSMERTYLNAVQKVKKDNAH